MTRSRAAWAIAGLDVVLFAGARWLDPTADVGADLLYAIGIASFAGVGALLCSRVPANPIGVLLLAAGTLLVAAVVVLTYAGLGDLQVPPWPGSDLAGVVGNTMFVYPFVIALIGVPLVFPDGRLPSPRFRWVVRIAIADMVLWGLLGLLFDKGTAARIQGLAFLVPVLGVVEPLMLVATLLSFGAAVYAVSLRFRRGDPVQRQQVKWLAAVVGVGAIVLPVSFLLNDGYPDVANVLSSIAIVAMFALPIVIGIAILRYRLFEIDRIISRTIGWVVVTGVLVTLFAGAVIALQALLAGFTQGQTLAVAASTLVAFALFQPLRRRVQRAVDRRFDRARYDGERTAADFAGRLRGQVDLVGLEAEFANTVQGALRPQSSAIWIRRGERQPAR